MSMRQNQSKHAMMYAEFQQLAQGP
jgi:hypothetical protein